MLFFEQMDWGSSSFFEKNKVDYIHVCYNLGQNIDTEIKTLINHHDN